ncbi:Mini-ribonuclease 3 [Paenibacillus larvae]|uniref:Mini-ribonuclease 3 n=4 Tax=Paenibacillus larvae TaxID=1464 RepID=V9WCV9_9BACL|nr:Mini-ribonuclease 3 [Paenibacillus larvae]AHD07560.1 ribonuclease [Paenibacillus larvae subsp. larvae DSM 25430]AVF20216.1 ribonuclease [Paenibacillus larvae subsp. larvae]AVF28568.1 ribonuclease [Paenibacillus larvae subsp. larvae]AVF33073.1 ribonuclease [Paenibacillus larvae subsp. larvae]AVG14120.1 ribonuclease [Paenibacillus larvae subsp. larvae DSM 25430]
MTYSSSNLFYFPPAQPANLLNPLVLAYVGDTLYDLFVRQYVISKPNQRPYYLHQQATRFVSAKAQARALEMLMPELSEKEKDIVKRGRNAKSGSVPKNADIIDYRHSTAFECLLGYLYYTQQYERLEEIMRSSIEAAEEK